MGSQGQGRRLGIEGLVEKKNGAFYRRRVGILHFHEDEDGVYADVKGWTANGSACQSTVWKASGTSSTC
jgi:hypothetical protein